MSRRPRAARTPPGFSLLELLVALAVVATLMLIATPSLLSLASRTQVELAARELVGVLRLARSHASRHGVHVAVKFYPGSPRTAWALYRDGDGDGVRTADIASGTDPLVLAPRILTHCRRGVGFGIPSHLAPRDPGSPGRRLDRLDDPIRFNRSDLASFGPLGTSTPGSLYLTDGADELLVVRLWGRTGKIQILRYDPRQERWE